MGMRSATWRVAAVVAVLLLGVSGCGGGGGDSGDGDGEEASESDRTTTTGRDVDADLAAASAALLRLSDLPEGWVEERTEADEDEGDDGLALQLAECLDVDPSLLATPDNPTNAESPDFSEPESGATVSNSVAFTESEAKAREVMEIFGRPELPSCLSTIMTRLLGEELPAGMTFGTVEVKRLAIGSSADETMAIRVQIPIEAEGTTIEQYLDMVLARVGRAGITLTFANLDAPVPADLEETALGIVVARLQGEEPASEDADEEAAQDEGTAFGPMAVQTAAEQAALEAAATQEGRRWASGGGPQGSTEAPGQPFLGGYVIHLTDGTTSYQVRVLGGLAVPFFGPAGDVAIVGPFSPGMHPTAEPETQAQADAITTAVIALGEKAESIETGGIELYAVYFDAPDADSVYFHVDVYAEATLAGTFAMGGTEVR